MRFLLLLLSLPLLAQQTYTVCSSGCTYTSLQTAINAAQTYQDGTTCGEVFLVLTAGQTFSGNFTLPTKTCRKYVTIRSSRYSDVPRGTRAGAANTASMALIRTPDTNPAMTMEQGGYWRFQMIEFTKAATGALAYPIVSILNPSAKQEAELPHHVIFDRVYVHGVVNAAEVIRGLSFGGRNIEVVDSSITDIMGQGIETQAIWCGGGCGEIVVTNSLLSAATENFLSGGNDGIGLSQYAIGFHPQSGFTFRGNYFYKDPSWKREAASGVPSRGCLVGELYQNTSGGQWYVCTVATGTWTTTSAPAYTSTPSQKNFFELKDGRRASVLGNLFVNSWDQAQAGSVLLINQTGQTSRAYNIQDINLGYNRGNWVGAGMNYGNLGYLWTPANGYVGTSITRASSHYLQYNLLTNHFYPGAGTGGSGRLFTLHTVSDITLRNNSFSGQATHGIVNTSDTADNWDGAIGAFNNAWGTTFPTYSWIGTGTSGSNWCALQNVVIADTGSLYFPAQALVGGSTIGTTCTGDTGPQLYSGTTPAAASDLYTNASSDWTIKSGSPAQNAGTDGRDIGTDIAMVNAAVSGAATGTLSDWHNFNIRGIRPSSSGATVYYSAPTSSACTTTVSTTEAFSSTTGTIGATTSVGLSRQVTVSALSASTPYWVRVVCGSYQYRIPFMTTL